MIRAALKALLLPPCSLFALYLVGLLLRRRRPRVARVAIGSAVAGMVLLSLPYVAALLMQPLQHGAPLPPKGNLGALGAQAIVVLAADHDRPGEEFGGVTIGPLTLQRLRYAAELAHRSGLRVLVSGGRAHDVAASAASIMRDILEHEHRVPVHFVEDASRDTFENARNSALLLRAAGIERILLVTHAWHMPRARASFVAHDLDVVAAPTARVRAPELCLGSLLPSARAFATSSLALHEMLGLLFYAFRRA